MGFFRVAAGLTWGTPGTKPVPGCGALGWCFLEQHLVFSLEILAQYHLHRDLMMWCNLVHRSYCSCAPKALLGKFL